MDNKNTIKKCNLCGSDRDIISRFVSCGCVTHLERREGDPKQKKGDIELRDISICSNCFSDQYYKLLNNKREKTTKFMKLAIWAFAYGLVSAFWIYVRETGTFSGFDKTFNIPVAIFLTIGIFAGLAGFWALLYLLISHIVTNNQLEKFKKKNEVPKLIGKKVFKRYAQYILFLSEDGRKDEIHGEFILPTCPEIIIPEKSKHLYNKNRIHQRIIFRVEKNGTKPVKHQWWRWLNVDTNPETWKDYKKEIIN